MLTLEKVDKLQYTWQAICEAMRLSSPLAITSAFTVTESCKIGDISIEPGSVNLYLSIKHTHSDPSEWKSPLRFAPERFDKTSSFANKPQGASQSTQCEEKRNPFAFNPFYGGERACLGKTLTESILKLTIPIIYHHFNFQIVAETMESKPGTAEA